MAQDQDAALTRARKFLTDATFIGRLEPTSLDSLMKRAQLRALAKGDTVYRRGDQGDSLMVIITGRLKIWNTTADAREVVLNFLGPGDINGEIAVLDGGPRTATATALEATEVMVLYRRDLMPVLEQQPEALVEVVQVLCEKLRAASEIVEDVQRTMRARVASGILRLARQHGKQTKDGIVFDLKASQSDLGAYLGLSRENTSRQLGHLRDGGIITIAGTAITVRDMDALSELAANEDA
jgi:CRP/FNR family transcriptional regulator, cyclic AMP receptor protein